jgi:hypothetical protein
VSGLRTTAAGVLYTVTVDTTDLPVGLTVNSVDPDGGNNSTSNVTLTNANGNRLDQDFGYVGTGSIGDLVWVDLNNNGTQDGGEPGIPGVTVTLTWAGADGNLLTPGDNETFTATTDANGNYSFPQLPAGNFQVDLVNATLPAGLTVSTGNDPLPVTLTTGQNYNTADFGARGTGSLGDRVFHDVNGNGSFDLGEGLSGVDVTVTADLDGDGTNESVTVVTGSDGLWTVSGLRTTAAGVLYTVTVDTTDLPVGLTVNSVDPDGGNNSTSNVTLTNANGNRLDQDFGYVGTGSIGDLVWVDLNNNGTQDAGEPGIPGVTVTLTWAGADGNLLTPGDNETYTATTDANGNYNFPQLPAGNFQVDLVNATLPAGLTVSTGNDPLPVTLTTGQNYITADFGARGAGSLGDRVFHDVNGNGSFDLGEGLIGVDVTVTADLDGDGSNESVTVVTGSDGLWTVSGLRTTAAGVLYTVTVDTTDLPVGLTVNSVDPDGGNNSTSNVTLTNANGSRLDQDFGYVGTGSIGDLVWVDLNNNGTQDGGEPGIPGVNLTLTWGGPDGNLLTIPDNETYTATTDANGNYSFPQLPAGNFQVDLVNATLPAGLTVSTGNDPLPVTLTTGQGYTAADFGARGTGSLGDRVFHDVNGNGAFDLGEGLSGVDVTVTSDLDGDGTNESVTVVTGSDGLWTVSGLRTTAAGVLYTVTVDTTDLPVGLMVNSVDPDGGNNSTSTVALTNANGNRLDQDFGYLGTGSIGDLVWVDLNNNGTQDAGEPGIPGVTLTLTWAGPDGDLLTIPDNRTYTATTDANGNYSFPQLPAGNFQVDVVNATLPAGLTVSTGNDPLPVTLTTGQGYTSADFGARGAGSLGDRVFHDVNGNGSFDLGEGLSGVDVTVTADLDGDGTNESVTVATGSDGLWTVSGLRTTAAGVLYTVTVDTTDLPVGLTVNSVDPDGGNNSTSNVTLTDANGTSLDQDFGYVGTGSIGDLVWMDLNNNGTQDGYEPGIPGVTLTLTWAGADGNLLTPGDNETYTATTDANGNYNFLQLPAGNFQVDVVTATLPAGLSLTTANNPYFANLPADTVLDNVDFGFRGPGRIDGVVFRDSNQNGLPDSGERIANAVVNVTADIDGDGTAEVITLTTDSQGNYSLPGLPVDNGAGGGIGYSIVVDPASLPPGLVVVVDPDAVLDAATQRTLTNLQPTASNVDFGFLGSASIAGTVFADYDRNTLIGASEPGIANVSITLIGTDVTGASVLRNLRTNTSGNFIFDDLLPGTYTLLEVQPEGYGDWFDRAGTNGGTVLNDVIRDIVLASGDHAQGYTFGELDPLHYSKRDFLSAPYYSNPSNQFDVNADGADTPLDALVLINALNEIAAPSEDSSDGSQYGAYYLDVTGDSQLTPLDVLFVINRLNQIINSGNGEGEGEGEGQGNVALIARDTSLPVVAPAVPVRPVDYQAAAEIFRSPAAVDDDPSDDDETAFVQTRMAGHESDDLFGDAESLEELLGCGSADNAF